MKICFINLPAEFYTVDRPGGVAIVIQGLARALAPLGHEVIVVSRHSSDLPLDGGRVISWHYPQREELDLAARAWLKMARCVRGWDWSYYGRYRAVVSELVRRERPDFVAAHNDPYAATWLRGTGAGQTAIWFHNTMGSYRPRYRDLTRVDWLAAPSTFLANWISAHFTAPSGGVAIVPNASDPDAFYPATHRGDSGPLRVLFVGRFDPDKGPDLVVDAVAALLDSECSVTLTLVGRRWWWESESPTDSYAGSVLAKAQASGARWVKRVARSEMGELYRSHDVVCIPSRVPEGFSLVAAEAMACGCAVITSGRGGLAEACADAAIVVDVESCAELTQVLRHLSLDRAALRAAQLRASRRGAQLTWDLAATELVKRIEGRPASRGTAGRPHVQL